MRSMLALAAPLAAAALTAPSLAAAQAVDAQPVAAGRAVPVVLDGGATVGAVPRTVATYRFTRARDAFMPKRVTIADSAGVLLARFQLPGDREARPMEVDLTNRDLVLHGETPAGVLTLLFYQRPESADAGIVAGRWWLGERGGELRGRVTR